MTLIQGNKLSPSLRKQVLNSFGFRWTNENEQRARVWFGRLKLPTMKPVPDAEWLESHAFHVLADGSRLDARHNHCEPAFVLADSGVS